MDLNFTPEEEAFRTDVQRFLRDRLPQRLADKVHGGHRARQWPVRDRLHDQFPGRENGR